MQVESGQQAGREQTGQLKPSQKKFACCYKLFVFFSTAEGWTVAEKNDAVAVSRFCESVSFFNENILTQETDFLMSGENHRYSFRVSGVARGDPGDRGPRAALLEGGGTLLIKN